MEDVLKDYARVDMTKPINGHLTHGWTPWHGVATHINRKMVAKKKSLRNTRILTWNERNVDATRMLGFRDVVCIGSPFIYIRPKKIKADKKSLIFMPSHATSTEPYKNAAESYSKLLDKISPVLQKFDTTICLSKNEFDDLEARKVWKNYKVVTLGDINDNKFLYKYQDLVGKYEYMATNIFSTALLYALHMGKKAFLLGDIERGDRDAFEWKEDIFYSINERFTAMYPEILWENFDEKNHKHISDHELGVKYKMFPDELAEVLHG